MVYQDEIPLDGLRTAGTQGTRRYSYETCSHFCQTRLESSIFLSYFYRPWMERTNVLPFSMRSACNDASISFPCFNAAKVELDSEELSTREDLERA